MTDVLVPAREALPRLHGPRPQGAPQFVPKIIDSNRQRDKLPPTPAADSNAAGEVSPSKHPEPPIPLGSLLYLGSVGVIACAIVLVFFGAGFFLLAPTAGGAISGSVDRRADLAITSLPPSRGRVQQTFFNEQSTRRTKDEPQNSAPLPAPTEATVSDGKGDMPQVVGVLASKGAADLPAASANASVRTPKLPAPTAPASPNSEPSNAEITELLDHGDALLRTGDVASARLFYERAAEAGDARAALRLAASFDPAFLNRLGVDKLQANPAKARSWYSRALDLGAVDAKPQLNSLGGK